MDVRAATTPLAVLAVVLAGTGGGGAGVLSAAPAATVAASVPSAAASVPSAAAPASPDAAATTVSASWASTARPAATPAAAPAHAWAWPLRPRPAVVRPFSAPVTPYGPGHRGVDLAASAGQPVLAVAAGVVTHAGSVAGRGTVTVAHPSGLRSTYEPLRPEVARGTPVAAGSVLGVLEPQGAASGHCGRGTPCLHLGALHGTAYLDPLALLEDRRVILLPLR